jgi:hypothetical protein
MNSPLEGNVQTVDAKQVGLYKINFEIKRQQRTVELLLSTKKKNKKDKNDVSDRLQFYYKEAETKSKKLNLDLGITLWDLRVDWKEQKHILNY